MMYRYMSKKEFFKLCDNLELVNSRQHSSHARTASVGFCFLEENTKLIDDRGDEHLFSPIDCYQFLSGVVSEDVLVEFDVDKDKFISGFGVYACPIYQDWYARCSITEYSVKEYSRDEFHPVRYCFPNENIWYELN